MILLQQRRQMNLGTLFKTLPELVMFIATTYFLTDYLLYSWQKILEWKPVGYNFVQWKQVVFNHRDCLKQNHLVSVDTLDADQIVCKGFLIMPLKKKREKKKGESDRRNDVIRNLLSDCLVSVRLLINVASCPEVVGFKSQFT